LTFFGLNRARHSLEIAHREISARYAAQLDVEKQLKLHTTAFNSAHDGITLTDAKGIILDINPAFTRITGYERSDAIGHNPRVLKSGRHDPEFYAAMWRSIKETGNWRGEIWNRNKYGEVYPELLSISAVHDASGQLTNYVAVFADIRRIKDQEKQLTQMAYYDALTELPNRVLLADRLVQTIAQTRRAQTLMAICYLDLDGFKPINDTWGHEVGDKVLVDIANRLKEMLRGGDTVARLGGDEFVLLLGGAEQSRGMRRRRAAHPQPDRLAADLPARTGCPLGEHRRHPVSRRRCRPGHPAAPCRPGHVSGQAGRQEPSPHFRCGTRPSRAQPA
jgi:PAS domain S-box-containing protein